MNKNVEIVKIDVGGTVIDLSDFSVQRSLQRTI